MDVEESKLGIEARDFGSKSADGRRRVACGFDGKGEGAGGILSIAPVIGAHGCARIIEVFIAERARDADDGKPNGVFVDFHEVFGVAPRKVYAPAKRVLVGPKMAGQALVHN